MKWNFKQMESYQLLQERELADIHSEGYYLLHKKSGAKVVVISNDDPNKVFYIGFRTPPNDNTGVPHIIEHTVLCGSRKFPVKDPFIELVKGSMNTFLNAMTYPDKTVYPVASCNDKDFLNLMDVYMDAVLHPNIYDEENIFRQEGWHFDLDAPEDDLTINGVVYNEMKGAYSVPDSILAREIQRSLYPDTAYANDSGGDPDEIPHLTYEQYLDYHRTYYHPSNSYIYLYGDMDVAERLEWLDREYLSDYERTAVNSVILEQDPFEEPKESEMDYPISSGESEENQTFLCYNWSVGSNLDPVQYVAFDILGYALLTSQGAPVKQALLDAGIGDDIYGGYDGGILQPMFSVIAKNTEPEKRDEFIRIIRHVLTEQAEKGINRTTLLAAINGAEFRYREADFGRIPKGLMFGISLLDSWLYDSNQPFLHMDELAVYEKLRTELNQGYFEELIWKYLLGNSHATILTLKPKKGLNAGKERAQADALRAYRDSLGADGIEKIISESRALAAYQEEPSSPADLATIPMLSREDMKKTPDPHSNVEEQAGDVSFLWHDYETNGILYLDYLFDISHVPEELVPYLSLLKTVMGRMDTADYHYVDLANEIDLYTGGISADVDAYEQFEEDRDYLPMFEIEMRTLEKNLDKTLELAQSMMLSTSFEDEKRLYEILAQSKSQMQVSIRESGNSVASRRVMSYTSRKSKYLDLLHGIGYYRVLERIVNHFEEEKEDLRAKLNELVKSVFTSGALLVSCTCRENGFDLVKARAGKISEGLYGGPKECEESSVSLPDVVNEGFMDASQIQFVAMGGNYRKKGLEYTGALRVFRCIMNYEYLWQNIRVRGGAYGCGCTINRAGDICFSTYRDPNLGKTLDVFRGVTGYLREFTAEERDMTRYVIGTFSEMDAPLTPAGQGHRSLVAKLCGITQQMLQKDRDEVLSCDVESIRALASLLEAALDGAYCCAIGNEEKIREESDLFDHTEVL